MTPPQFVIPPQQMGELLLVYNMSGSVPPTCPSPLACLKLVTGDELVRQRLCRVYTKQKDGSPNWSLRNPDNKVYLKPFKHQESVPTGLCMQLQLQHIHDDHTVFHYVELEFNSLEVEDNEQFFEQHLSKISISLSGSLPTESPLNMKSVKTSGVTFDLSPPQQKALSPSHTPLVFGGGRDLTNKQSPSLRILAAHTLTLPDTAVGHYSEKALEIYNPYSSPLHWHLSSVASPFLRNVSINSNYITSNSVYFLVKYVSLMQISGCGGSSGEIFKANYSVFWVHERRGTVLPQQMSKVHTYMHVCV